MTGNTETAGEIIDPSPSTGLPEMPPLVSQLPSTDQHTITNMTTGSIHTTVNTPATTRTRTHNDETVSPSNHESIPNKSSSRMSRSRSSFNQQDVEQQSAVASSTALLHSIHTRSSMDQEAAHAVAVAAEAALGAAPKRKIADQHKDKDKPSTKEQSQTPTKSHKRTKTTTPSHEQRWNEYFAMFQEYIQNKSDKKKSQGIVATNGNGDVNGNQQDHSEHDHNEHKQYHEHNNHNHSTPEMQPLQDQHNQDNDHDEDHSNDHDEANDHDPHQLQTTHPGLYKWVQQQRNYASKWEAGLPSPMTLSRLNMLSNANFFESFPTKWDIAWRNHYHDLRRVLDQVCADADDAGDNDGNDIGKTQTQATNTPTKNIKWEAIERTLTPELKGWIRRQRIEYTKFLNTERSSMTRHRIGKLDEIQFQWEPTPQDDITDPRFLERIEEMKAFRKKHGHLMIPKIYPPNKSLGRWVARQRAQYRSMQANPDQTFGLLTESRIRVMDELGFQWVSTSKFAPGVTWDKRFEELKAYKAKHGHFNVPRTAGGSAATLATWVRNQRCFYMAKKRGKGSPMNRERVAKLEAIGFEWKLRGGSSDK